MNSASDLTSQVGVAVNCQALAIPHSNFYRSRQGPRIKMAPPAPTTLSPRTLSEEEQTLIRETLNSPRFADQTPRAVYATLLDEQKYLCSWQTMYRILNEHRDVRERRNQLRHLNDPKPEPMATSPNQLWSWDITRLLGPTKGTCYQLYVIIDVLDRYAPGCGMCQ